MRALATTLLAVVVTGCGGAKSAVDTSAADQAAITKIHEEYVTHFNLHHASAVADLMADSAVFLGADGSVDVWRAAIVAGLEQTMAASPSLTLAPAETKVMGDHALTRGGYTLAMTPPGGAAITLTGNYLTEFERANGAWKIGGVVTNYDAPPPEGLPRDTATTPPPPESGTMKELVGGFVQHYNLGHASVVAGLFTDSAVAMFADTPISRGRAAIESYLTGQVSQGSPQLTVHDVNTEVLPGGWAIDGGWWEVSATTPDGPMNRVGAYMLLARQQADQTWKIEWFATNGGVVPTTVAAK
mgnify:CR=1 FL=1